MRVTDRTISNNAISHMTESLGNYYDIMEKNASGKQFRWASDNVTNAVASLSIRSTIQLGDAFIENAKSTDLWMTATDAGLEDMEDLATRAINLTLQGLSDTMGDEQRQAISTELDSILDQAVATANTQHQNNYVFSGFQTKTKPFAIEANPTPPPADMVTYYGDNGVMTRNIGPDAPVEVNVNGTLFNTAGHDIFSDLITLRDSLATFDRAAADTGLQSLRTTLQYFSDAHTEFAGRQRELHDAMDRMDKTKISLQSLLSQKEDINQAEAVTKLAKDQTIYQTVLQVSQRAISTMNMFERM